MPLYKGTTEIAGSKLYKGTTEIENVYKGSSMVYQNNISFNSHFLIAGGGADGSPNTYNYYNNTSEQYDESWNWAGGGAGGVRTSFAGGSPVANGGGQSLDTQLAMLTNTAYAIVVGDNGTSVGGESSVGSLVAVGGGGNSTAYYGSQTMASVPSNGGGGGGYSIGHTGNAGNVNQPYYPGNYQGYIAPAFVSGTYGFNGNVQNSYYKRSGGGGGAGSAATNTILSIGGSQAMTAGGSGITSSITGSSVAYGVGGNGVYANLYLARPAVTTSGSGGHGGGTENAYKNQSSYGFSRSNTAGTDGCVILRFPNARSYTATGSPTLTTDGSDKILQWTTAGTYTITFT
tara:strand:+ start:931 stop:1965 length:1035 start_codon:yes stop_codon:yes gene_type:complete